MSHVLVTLAQSGQWIDLLAAAAGVIIIVGGGIARALGELTKKRRDNAARRSMPMHSSSAQGDATLEEMAARRMAQLRGSAGTEPGNMTMAERVERARAKVEYERRARQMAQPRRGTAAPGSPQPELQQRIEERRAQREAQLRAKAQREAMQRRERQSRQRYDPEEHRRAQAAQEQEQERARREAVARQQAEQARRAAELKRQQQRAAYEAQMRAKERKSQQRIRVATQQPAAVPAAAAAVTRPVAMERANMTSPPRSASLAVALRDRASLRQAFILKEVLDAPVGLRGST